MRSAPRAPFRARPTRFFPPLALAIAAVASANAHAHFQLLEPPSWVQEDAGGNPQKTGPCGGAVGDSGLTPSGAVTTFTVGETIRVRWQETVPHPGHFRIALTKPNETRAALVDPFVTTDANNISISADTVADGTGNVLKDDLFSRADVPAVSPDPFEAEITLPDEPCDNCTLQVLQFMASHAPGYFYYHCADIRIVDKTVDTTGAGGAAAAMTGTGGAGTAGAAATGAGGAAPSASSANDANVQSPTFSSNNPSTDRGGGNAGAGNGVTGMAGSTNGGAGGAPGASTAGSADASGISPASVNHDAIDAGCSLVAGAKSSPRRSAPALALFGIAASLWRRRARR
jgi:hypothetical protein